ncbi:MAG: prevent-host-death protein [Oscillospiraceae bacterium]|nr:prevent-host-death protein [Oscillospiraceae bacterium]
MLNIKPVSDLRNYNDVLRDCGLNNPVYLTKNGRGRYVLVDIAEYEKKNALLELYAKLAEGEKQIENGKYMSLEEARARLRKKYAE